MDIAENVLGAIGRTPLIKIGRLNRNPDVTLTAKLESANPGGSIKDRVALAMIEAAEKSGELAPGKTVIEATSGNTGIGLAMVCAVKGYAITLVMSEAASEERKSILRAYGAELIQTPARFGTDGAIEEAYRLAREEPDRYVLMDQYNNPASIEAHCLGTAREIWEQTEGRVSCVVACLGTTGTAMGLCRGLKTLNPAVRVVGVEPFAGHKIQGLKNMQESYPPGIYDRSVLDEVVHVEDERAFGLCRDAARKEGLFIGMSGGAALAGALDVAADMAKGLVVVILPDAGDRYLSTSLYAGREDEGPALGGLDESRTVRPFSSRDVNVLYTPGPSLDRTGDLEFWRRLLHLDVLARYLGREGFTAQTAVGLADFDDRAVAAARSAGQTREVFCHGQRDRIAKLCGIMGVASNSALIFGGSDAEGMTGVCTELLNKGLAYEKLRSLYYDVQRDSGYGELSGMDTDKLSPGKTVDLERYAKDDPRDFTLLKRATLQDLKEGTVFKTKWGNVRPSWHLQMAWAGLLAPKRIRLFMAGSDQVFPHIENVGGIWRALGLVPGCWCASGPVRGGSDQDSGLDGLLAQGWSAHALRMWLLSAAWRRSLDAGDETLAMWAKNQKRVQETAAMLRACSGHEEAGAVEFREEAGAEVRQAAFDLHRSFRQTLDADLGIFKFWPALFEFCREINRLSAGRAGWNREARICLDALFQVDEVLGILDRRALPLVWTDVPAEVRDLVVRRGFLRESRDFSGADGLRAEIEGLGFRLEDGPAGPRIFGPSLF